MHDYIRLSKEISYALRHSPERYGLELDENGWVNINELVSALNQDDKWKCICSVDLIKMIEVSEKRRHEISGGKIRALYGHTISTNVVGEISEPPEYLFHGTARRFVSSIKEKGLLSQSRQYVHLSADEETAYKVGKRRDNKPIVLRIRAKQAYKHGTPFFQGNDTVWLSEAIKSEFIEFI